MTLDNRMGEAFTAGASAGKMELLGMKWENLYRNTSYSEAFEAGFMRAYWFNQEGLVMPEFLFDSETGVIYKEFT